MILTVTLNPAIDIRYEINDFEINNIFRKKPCKTPGGKGLNVSRVLTTLGSKVEATGFLGGSSGEWIASEIENIGIRDRFIKTTSETRSCIAILGRGTQTEILEPGESISREFIDQFLEFFKTNYSKFQVICISGSAPKGLKSDFYKLLSQIAQDKKVLLDTSGEFLINGLEGTPYLVKPNKDELEGIFNRKLNSIEEIISAGKELKNKGCKNVLISLGKDGAIFIDENNKTFKVNIPKIQVKNPVGSGDSTIAGFAHAISREHSIEEALKLAMACGISNAMCDETGHINISHVESLFKEIQILPL